MILLQKRILNVGRINGVADLTTRKPESLRVSPKLLRSWQRRIESYRKKGLLPPVYLGHPDPPDMSEPIEKQKLLSRRRKDRNLVGFVRGFRVTRDGKAAIVTIFFLDSRAGKLARQNKLELSPRYNVERIGDKLRLRLLTFDLLPAGEAADKLQSRFLTVKQNPKRKGTEAMKTTKKRTTQKRRQRLNVDPGMESPDAMDLSKLSDREVKLLRRVHETIRELGPQSDPLATALRVLWPSQAAEIIGEGEGEDEVTAVTPGLAALSLDRRKVGSDGPQHAYAGGNVCSAEQAQKEVTKLKARHPGMFK